MKHLHRILLVDDEPEVTRSLKTALRKEPWDIETADSGEQALDLMDDQEFDVIVSDERMPGIRGADLLGQVRDRFPGTIRVMLSGTIEQIYRAGELTSTKEDHIDQFPGAKGRVEQIYGEFGIVALPITVILNPEGQEIARMIGDAEWNSESAKAIISASKSITFPNWLTL